MSQCCTRNQRIALELFALVSLILLLSGCSYNELERIALERADTAEDIPISEQTGYQQWTDEWRNFIRNGEKPIYREKVQIIHDVSIKK